MIYRRDYQSHIKSQESISITKPVTNSLSSFKVGDYITHNSFGVGKITKETPEYYVIRFDSINESKVISKKYKCLTIYEQKFIFHNNYKYGTILKEDISTFTILFDNGEEKIISKKYTGLKLLNEAEYKNRDLATLNKIENQPINVSNDKPKLFKYNLVKHDAYGKGIIVYSDNETLTVLFSSTKKLSFSSTTDKLTFLEDYSKKVESINYYKSLNYIYCEGKGYGYVCLIGNNDVHILWKSSNDIEIISKFILLLATKITNEETIKILNLEKNNLVKHAHYGIVKIDSFLDKQIGYKLANENNLIFWNKIDEFSIPTKKELMSSKISNNLVFGQLLEKRYYSLKEANELYEEFTNTRQSTFEVIKVFSSLGYKFIDEETLIKKERYGNLELFLIKEFLKQEVYRYDYMLESNEYDYAINKLILANYCIEYQEGVYFTFKKLSSMGIELKDFENLEKDILLYLDKNKFANINQFKSNIDNVIFKKIINVKTLEKILNNIQSIKSINVGGINLYQNKNGLKKAESVTEMFVMALKELNKKSIDVNELIDFLNEKYDFEFDYYSFLDFLKTIKNDSLFYCDETEKIYINKRQYIKEVFGVWN